jgi:hypothetical protein
MRPRSANAENGMFHMTSRPSPARLARGLLLFASFSALAWAQRPASRARVAPGRWSEVAHTLGVAGEIRGDVFRVEFAPAVHRVWMRGIRLAPGTIEPSWVSFGQEGGLGWMMGHLLLPAARGSVVAGHMVRAGLDVTSLADPLPGSRPALSAVYFRGMGDSVRLARQLKTALGRALRPPPERSGFRTGRLPVAAIDKVMGRRGGPLSGALIFRLTRPETVKCCGLKTDPLRVFSGIPLAPANGLESRVAFQPVGAVAAVSGCFAVLHSEAGPVERALRIFGIQTVALDEPFSDEYPRILFLHFFGKGKPLELAQGVRAAIERIHHLPPVTAP